MCTLSSRQQVAMPVAMELASFGKISFDTAGLYQATAELRSEALRMMMPAAPAEAGGVPGGATSNWKVLRLPVVQALRPHCTSAAAGRRRPGSARRRPGPLRAPAAPAAGLLSVTPPPNAEAAKWPAPSAVSLQADQDSVCMFTSESRCHTTFPCSDRFMF